MTKRERILLVFFICVAMFVIGISIHTEILCRQTFQTLDGIQHPVKVVSVEEATKSGGWISWPNSEETPSVAGEDAIFVYPLDETTKTPIQRTKAQDAFRNFCPRMGNDRISVVFQRYKLRGRECEAAFFIREPEYLYRRLHPNEEP